MPTPAQQISDFVHTLRYADVPADARAFATRCLVDHVGVALATPNLPFARIVSDMVVEWGGAPESTVIALGARVPAPNAILANGTMMHGMDFDDTHSEGIAHLGACIIPAALAIAEKVGAGGDALMAAIVAGLEVQARIASAASTKFHARGFHPTNVTGSFATALVAGKLLGLSPEQLTNALGICLNQASGTLECLDDGTWAKRFTPGWAGHAGAISARMAARGYTGSATAFEGPRGLYMSHAGEGNYSIERLLRGLGTEWETPRLLTKRFPSCYATHCFINCARTLRREHGFSPDDVEEVECRIQRMPVRLVCEPAAPKRRPQTTYIAQFSLYYTVAVALMRGTVDLDDFTEENIQDPAVLKLAERVRYTAYDETPYNSRHPGTVIVRLRDGRELRQSYEDDVENPMTDADVADKFRRNARRSLPPDQVERLFSALKEAPSADDVRELTALMVAP